MVHPFFTIYFEWYGSPKGAIPPNYQNTLYYYILYKMTYFLYYDVKINRFQTKDFS